MSYLRAFILAIFSASQLRINQVEGYSGARIIGGNSAYAGQFPYAVAIYVQTANSRFFCGGTLVDSEWILTAGQCVDGATLFTIHLGSNNLENDDPNRIIVATSEYYLHPNYSADTLENDIALIKLRIPVEYSNYLNKISFLGSHYVVDGTLLLAVGWGQISDDNSEFSNDLKWANVAAVSNNDCKLNYGNQIYNSTICISGSYNEGICYGDTGSALIQDIGRGYMMHVGIASFISANGCESTDPSGFVRTYHYRDWIKEVAGI